MVKVLTTKEYQAIETKAKFRPLYVIASEISKDWQKVNYAARPYLEAMFGLNKITDMYICDSAISIVSYFLCNASTWKGEKAKAIKKELNAMIK